MKGEVTGAVETVVSAIPGRGFHSGVTWRAQNGPGAFPNLPSAPPSGGLKSAPRDCGAFSSILSAGLKELRLVSTAFEQVWLRDQIEHLAG